MQQSLTFVTNKNKDKKVMEANYRIIKIGKKYFPQVKFRRVVTVGKNQSIQPILD